MNQTTPALHDTPLTLIDCPYEGLLRTKIRFNLAIPALVVTILFFVIVVLPNELFTSFVLVLCCIPVCWVACNVATERHLARVLSPDFGIPSTAAIRDALTPRWFDARTRIYRIPRKLAHLNCRNVTARVCKPKDLTPVQPMEETFEPIPLDETGSLFAQLESDSAQDAPSTPRVTSTLARNIRLGGGWFALILFSFALLMSMIESIRLKHITGMLIQWSIMTGILVLGIGKGAWRSRFQWFLIPGGLAVRRARRWKGDWQLELYERTQSVLVVHNRHRIWTVSVASAERATKAAMTQREARMLLRAWLSPLPTPPLAQLSDLV